MRTAIIDVIICACFVMHRMPYDLSNLVKVKNLDKVLLNLTAIICNCNKINASESSILPNPRVQGGIEHIGNTLHSFTFGSQRDLAPYALLSPFANASSKVCHPRVAHFTLTGNFDTP